MFDLSREEQRLARGLFCFRLAAAAGPAAKQQSGSAGLQEVESLEPRGPERRVLLGPFVPKSSDDGG